MLYIFFKGGNFAIKGGNQKTLRAEHFFLSCTLGSRPPLPLIFSSLLLSAGGLPFSSSFSLAGHTPSQQKGASLESSLSSAIPFPFPAPATLPQNHFQRTSTGRSLTSPSSPSSLSLAAQQLLSSTQRSQLNRRQQQRRPHQGASSAVIGSEQQPTHGSAGATLFVISFNRSAAALLQQRHPQTHGLPLQPQTPFLLSPLTGQPPPSSPQLQQPRTTVAVRASIGRSEPNREGRRQRNGTDLRRKTKADPEKQRKENLKSTGCWDFAVSAGHRRQGRREEDAPGTPVFQVFQRRRVNPRAASDGGAWRRHTATVPVHCSCIFQKPLDVLGAVL